MIDKKGVISCVLLILLIVLPIASAGVGIKTSRSALLVEEGKEVCVTDYSVYNPWPEESYVTVEANEELSEVLKVKEMVPLLVPAETYNEDSIPVKFCFEIPRVYARDCLIGDFLFCEQTCDEEQKTFEGEIVVKSVPAPADLSGGSGGSATQMSVSAPLKLRVVCEAHGRSYTPAYILLALISILIVAYLIWSNHRKPESVRRKEKLLKLKKEMDELKSGK